MLQEFQHISMCFYMHGMRWWTQQAAAIQWSCQYQLCSETSNDDTSPWDFVHWLTSCQSDCNQIVAPHYQQWAILSTTAQGSQFSWSNIKQNTSKWNNPWQKKWIRDDGLPQRTQWTFDEPLQLSEGGSTHTALLFCAPEASRLSCAVHMMHSKPRFETPKPTIPCES